VVVVTWDEVTKRRTEALDRIAMALAERRLLVLGDAVRCPFVHLLGG